MLHFRLAATNPKHQNLTTWGIDTTISFLSAESLMPRKSPQVQTLPRTTIVGHNWWLQGTIFVGVNKSYFPAWYTLKNILSSAVGLHFYILSCMYSEKYCHSEFHQSIHELFHLNLHEHLTLFLVFSWRFNVFCVWLPLMWHICMNTDLILKENFGRF